MNTTIKVLLVVGGILLAIALVIFGIPALICLDQDGCVYNTLDDVPEDAASFCTETYTITDKAFTKYSGRTIYRLFYLDENGEGDYIDVASQDYARYAIGDEVHYSTYRAAPDYWDVVQTMGTIVVAFVLIFFILVGVAAM